jgi:hypothetical protein
MSRIVNGQQLIGVEEADAKVRDMSDATLALYAADAPASGVPMNDSEVIGQRARNEVARRKHQAEKQAAQQAEQAKHAHRQEVALDAYRAQARAAFPGDDAAFSRLWPQLRDAYLVDATRQQLSAQEQLIEQKRRQIGSI